MSSTEQNGQNGQPRHLRVLIVGAGFSGLGMAKVLRGMGISDFLVLDRGSTVGGTWRDNTYPGCGCDIASHLYSFSFAPNPGWSSSYSLQPEILRYLERVARDLALEQHILLGTEVHSSRWDDGTAAWQVETSRGRFTADILVGAAGPLSQPQTPSLPGLAGFPGPVFHSASWRHDVDLTGKRVAVVGTGASAVQFVPRIQPEVAHLTVFQRTPPWVLPRGDRRISDRERGLFARVPLLQKIARGSHYTARESQSPAFFLAPRLMAMPELLSRAQIRKQIKDPALRAAVTPDYRFGCKRVLPSNTYYPALTAANVELVPHALASVEGSTVIGADGSRAEVDVIIFGTGFDVTSQMRMAQMLVGADGRSLSEVWAAEGRSALRSTTLAGFPNLFLLLGPGSGLGHSSMVLQIESQTAYIADAIAAMSANRLAAIEPKAGAQRSYNDRLQRRMRRTVWQTGGCVSWYQDADGRNTSLWPGSTLQFRHDTRSVDLTEYHLRELDPAVHSARQAQASLTGVMA